MTSKFMMVLAAYLHVIGVAAYLGGAIVMEFVLSPAQKFVPPAQQAVIGQKSADRFLVVAWSALGVIAFSGVLRLFSVGAENILTEYSGSYGRTLLVMILLWATLVVNGAVITFNLRPQLAAKQQGGVQPAEMQAHQASMIKASEWVARLIRADLVIAVLVALLGASLAFGGVF